MRKTHNERRPITKEYQAWGHMKRRCYNKNTPQYKDYGGRGIKVCDRWINSYTNFLADVGRAPSKDHTIDRVNNDGDYEPSNVVWSTRQVQNLNRRNKNLVTYKGDTKNISVWANQLKIDRNTLLYRLKKNWPLDKVFKNIDNP